MAKFIVQNTLIEAALIGAVLFVLFVIKILLGIFPLTMLYIGIIGGAILVCYTIGSFYRLMINGPFY